MLVVPAATLVAVLGTIGGLDAHRRADGDAGVRREPLPGRGAAPGLRGDRQRAALRRRRSRARARQPASRPGSAREIRNTARAPVRFQRLNWLADEDGDRSTTTWATTACASRSFGRRSFAPRPSRTGSPATPRRQDAFFRNGVWTATNGWTQEFRLDSVHRPPSVRDADASSSCRTPHVLPRGAGQRRPDDVQRAARLRRPLRGPRIRPRTISRRDAPARSRCRSRPS